MFITDLPFSHGGGGAGQADRSRRAVRRGRGSGEVWLWVSWLKKSKGLKVEGLKKVALNTEHRTSKKEGITGSRL